MSRPNPKSDTGFTLMELVVVLSVFALVALLSLQALSGTLRTRDRLVGLDTQTRDIALALSLLRSDLTAAAPLTFHPPNGPTQSAFDISQSGAIFAFSITGRPDLPGETSAGFGRVIWRFDAGNNTLTRQDWPTLIPAHIRAQNPPITVAQGITGLTIRQMLPGGASAGWITGPNPDTNGTSSTLPRAIDIIVQTRAFGALSTLVSYP